MPGRTPGEQPTLATVLQQSLETLSQCGPGRITDNTTVGDIERELLRQKIEPGSILAEGALHIYRGLAGDGARGARDGLEFLLADKRPASELLYTSSPTVQWSLDPKMVLRAVVAANRTVELAHDLLMSNDVPIFKLLGLRNLSSFVGEIFAGEIYKLQKDRFLPNPNQDGYPDLMAMTPEGAAYVEERKRRGQMHDKEFWSPFPSGGIEVKATCGNTPSSKEMPKPKIGESRIPILVSAEWKAHHRNTNNLLGIYWDFVAGLPTVLAAFFRNDLTKDDWGKVVIPKEDGGNTTSVSIMMRGGVKKMGDGWLVLPKDSAMLKALCQSRVFGVDPKSFPKLCSKL